MLGYKKVDPDCWEFANEGFLRGHKHLLKTIIRRKPSSSQMQETPSLVRSAPLGQVGKSGIEEDVERLKRDKTVHMDELLKLRQQQQATDQHLENVGQRLQLMEQRQQQTMTFLAKALHSPGFITQLVHQQNERITGMKNKKRRHPNQEEENYAGEPITTLHGRQIVRYQPLINQAAIALLQKLLNTNASGRLETKVNGFLTNHAHLSENTGGTSNPISGITLSELPTSSQSHLMSDAGSQFNSYSSSIPGVANVCQFPQLDALNVQTDHVLPDFTEGIRINTLETFGVTHLNHESRTRDVPWVDTMKGTVDGVSSIVPDGFSTETDVDLILNETHKLPGINDIFWDKILSACPLTEDKHEMGSLLLEDGLTETEDVLGVQEIDCDKMKHMNHLTKRMGLLASSYHSG